MSKVWIIRRQNLHTNGHGDNEPEKIIAVYSSRAMADERVKSIFKANRQYEPRTSGTDCWILGPEEDEGFFGNKPVILTLSEHEVQTMPTNPGSTIL